MKKYRCKKRLLVEQYNAERYWMPCQQIEIRPGAVFQMSSDPLEIATAPGVRLQADNIWLEVYPDTLGEHFEEVQ